MEVPAAALDVSESERDEYVGKKASLALQRALNGAGAWMITSVRDQRKCDHPLLPAEMPASIRAKVARILQDRGGKDKIPVEVPDPKAPWHQQLEQHVARLMQQMRSQPQQFRQLLLMAASEPVADCVASSNSSQGFVDARSAYRRLRRAAMALGEEIFYLVRAFVRRSESNGVFPQDAQVVRLASLYKLELRRHVTISAVIECIHQADNCLPAPSNKIHRVNKPGLCVIKKPPSKHPQLRRQVKSAGVTTSGYAGMDAVLSSRAASAPADAVGRAGQSQPALDSGTTSDKVKSVHAFKLQALERLLAKTWQGSRSASMRSLQAMPVSPTKLSDETLAQIQERVTAFLYHRSRENYPLWSEPPLSREETARHLRTWIATLMTSPLLQSLTIDQLLEVARASRWQSLDPGDTLCTRNTEIEALIVVMDGSLASSTAAESSSGPASPLPSTGAMISAPACLGELGMVRNTERWPRTLIAQSVGGVKVVTLPKLTFEALLHRFFNVGKAIPPALAAATSFLQPRRPSSSPAVIAKRLARSFRHSLSVRRPSTAAPTVAMEANLARWHEVRDEKLRDYRAGLEAEQRAAALEALQRAMEELSSASPEEQDEVEYLQHLSSPQSSKGPWSRHEYYPSFDPASIQTDSPETDLEEFIQHSHECIDPPQPNSSSPKATEDVAPSGTTEFADQLREFYRTLNARRSVMRARLASSAHSDQMVLPSPERKSSNVAGAAAITTAVSDTTWWVEEEEAENWSIPSEDEFGIPLDGILGGISRAGSPHRGRLRSASFSSQMSGPSAATSPSKEGTTPPSPLKSPLKSRAASPLQGPQHESNNCRAPSEDSDAVWLTGKLQSGVPETAEFDDKASPGSPSRNQVDDGKAATFTRARKSALNIMLIRQSSATMARHSKLLDKETAQQVLIQKHFADTSALGGSPCASRPHSGRPQSGHPSESALCVLHQSHSHAPLPLRADLQRRMDSVLNELDLPPKTKLDLVLKYTHADHYDQFPIAVQLWERVQGAVTRRERVMNSLWDFEMLASDPRRHFRSISTHRLREEKERDVLFSKLNQASNACVDAMDELLRCCGDTVCLGDRPYRDKMKKDYTELLYEVEQERLRIIYDGVRPHVALAIDDHHNVSVFMREEDDNLPIGSRPSSGRTVINIHVPSAVAIPRAFAPRRPPTTKDGSSPRFSIPSAVNNSLKEEMVLPAKVHGNQEQEIVSIGGQSPEFAIDGANADPTNSRHRLATPRESIFVPVSSLENKQESSTTEPEQHIRRASRVTIQVQQQRQAELAALSKTLEDQQKEDMAFHIVSRKDTFPPSQAIRLPEKTFIAPPKESKKSVARLKQQEERASLRGLFQQFISRSKS